ncbi:hypothetical protein EDD22DRAFT_851634 [Suillus occidentalis]|nr:hypothetical protein EDD22DRAFT_851634 [Suillus occidentalis]
MTQIPCRAMDIKQSTTDGNMEVLNNLFRQGGIGDPCDSGIDAEHDVDMSEHIMLIHGCSTIRWLVQMPFGEYRFSQRRAVMMKTACTNTLQSFSQRKQIEAENKNQEWNMLENFAASEPTWADMVAMSHAIVWKDELMYIDICQAMNTGDIRRVEASFLPWIYMFKAMGKHKFLVNLQFNWPNKLSDVIQINLLSNPSGHVLAFRAVDWVVRRNNLYTKRWRSEWYN